MYGSTGVEQCSAVVQVECCTYRQVLSGIIHIDTPSMLASEDPDIMTHTPNWSTSYTLMLVPQVWHLENPETVRQKGERGVLYTGTIKINKRIHIGTSKPFVIRGAAQDLSRMLWYECATREGIGIQPSDV